MDRDRNRTATFDTRAVANNATGRRGQDSHPAASVSRGRPGSQNDRNARKRNWFARHKIITFVGLTVLTAAIVLACLLSNAIVNPGAVLTNRPGGGQQSGGVGSGGEQPQQGQDGYTFPSDIVNFLILGTDSNAERVKSGMNARTDCIMLASINTTTKKVSLISIPRDTYVKIYDENNKVVSQNRINAAFSFGGGLKKNGIAYASNTVRQFFGGKIPIDHYVMFDMDLVKSLIDAVGGVTVDVDISLDFHNIHLRPGKQKLNGIEALTYARDRHNTAGGDFGRVGHQQQVMIALLKELQNKGNIVKKIPELYTALSKNVVTNPELGAMQITALAWIAKDVNAASIKQYTVHGRSMSINGASIVVADQEEKQTIMREVFGIDYEIQKEETYEHQKDKIAEILNAGREIINTAQRLLDDNKQYYTADEARNLRNAIAAWKAASKKNDSEGMTEAQQDVLTEYEILKRLIEERKAAETEPPEPTVEPTEPEITDEPERTEPPQETARPTESPSPTEEPAVTESPTPEPTTEPTPTPSEAPTESPQPTDAQA